MKIPLHYANTTIELSIPRANISEIISPCKSQQSGPSSKDIASAAINKNSASFVEKITDHALAVLLPDGTRDLPLQDIFPQLFRHFQAAKKIIFFICTGTHNAHTPENQTIIEIIQQHAQQNNIDNYQIISHDCRDADFINAGTTTRGTEVLYNAHLTEPDFFLVLSDVKPHYFGGYSNPVKNFVPGLCAFKTVEQNHSWTMNDNSRAGLHPWHADSNLHNNPLAQDQLEAMQTIVSDRQIWALVTTSSSGKIQSANFGPARQATAKAFQQADTDNCFTTKPVNKMIISAGGLPNDVDLYISQRALELTSTVLRDCGEIIFFSACPKGIGTERTKEQFYNKLILPLHEIENVNQKDYKLFSHKPWRLARLINRLNKIWMHCEIPPSEIEKIHLTPCPDPKSTIDTWLTQNPQEKILIVDGANKVLLRPEQ